MSCVRASDVQILIVEAACIIIARETSSECKTQSNVPYARDHGRVLSLLVRLLSLQPVGKVQAVRLVVLRCRQMAQTAWMIV